MLGGGHELDLLKFDLGSFRSLDAMVDRVAGAGRREHEAPDDGDLDEIQPKH